MRIFLGLKASRCFYSSAGERGSGMRQFIHSSLLPNTRYADADPILYRSLHRWIALLLLNLVLTLDSFVLGFAIATLAWVGAFDGRSRWAALGSISAAAGLPLLMFAAHCMDRIDNAANKIRIEYCRENGVLFDDPV